MTFRLGPVPVTLHGSFLLLALFGWLRYETLEYTLAWTLAVFLAILTHEAGHAFTARAFGATKVAIYLFAFGGATTYPVSTNMGPGRRFLVSAAGSAVGIATGAIAIAIGVQQQWLTVELAWPPLVLLRPNDFLVVFLISFITAALVWGILNWLPIRPLDGGQMLHSFLEIVAPSIAETGTKVVSLAVGIPVIVVALAYQEVFAALIVGFLLMSGLRSPPARPAPQSSSGRAGVPEIVDDGRSQGDSERSAPGSDDSQPPPPEFPI